MYFGSYGGKHPSTIKGLAKVLSELFLKLECMNTDLKNKLAQVKCSNLAIRKDLDEVKAAVTFVNDNSEGFKT